MSMKKVTFYYFLLMIVGCSGVQKKDNIDLQRKEVIEKFYHQYLDFNEKTSKTPRAQLDYSKSFQNPMLDCCFFV